MNDAALLRPRALALAALLAAACDQTAPAPPDRKPDPRAPAALAAAPTVFRVPLGDSPVRGAGEARVTVVVFSEFQCPYCARVEPTLAQIRKTYGDDVRIVWKHWPLPMHDRAVPAALAAEAAREQGRFWEMHDELFAHPQALGGEELEARARAAGLDLARFRASLTSAAARARVEDDRKLGATLGVEGTPSFFINGRPLVGAQPFEAFQTIIDEELVRAADKLRAGVARGRLYAAMTEGGLDKVAPPAAAPTGNGCHSPGCGAGGAAPKPEDTTTVYKVDPGAAPARGPAGAPVTVVLFSDFQCPYCKKIEPTLDALEKEYPGKVRVVWKNFPLDMHPSARLAAAAALAAHAQGKFWAMHDRLLENQEALSRDSLDGYARTLGLDPARFQAAFERSAADVEADVKQGLSLGVTGTPTVFVNGRRVAGAYPLATFKELVDQELAKGAGGTPVPGVRKGG
jgi:protein-disulfide isomerase